MKPLHLKPIPGSDSMPSRTLPQVETSPFSATTTRRKLLTSALGLTLGATLGRRADAARSMTAEQEKDTTLPVTITVQTDKPIGAMKPIWRFFGADEPNYAYRKDGRKLVSELGQLRHDQVYFRTHNLLTSGDGTPALKWGSTNAYTEDAQGNPVYDWTIVDRIFDTYRANGVRPYVQIGFMPEALSVHPEPYRHHWTQGRQIPRGRHRGPLRPSRTLSPPLDTAGKVRRDLHRMGLPAQRLREMGRTGLPVGAPLRGALWATATPPCSPPTPPPASPANTCSWIGTASIWRGRSPGPSNLKSSPSSPVSAPWPPAASTCPC